MHYILSIFIIISLFISIWVSVYCQRRLLDRTYLQVLLQEFFADSLEQSTTSQNWPVSSRGLNCRYQCNRTFIRKIYHYLQYIIKMKKRHWKSEPWSSQSPPEVSPRPSHNLHIFGHKSLWSLLSQSAFTHSPGFWSLHSKLRTGLKKSKNSSFLKNIEVW